MEKKEYWHWMINIKGITRKKCNRLLEDLGGIEALYKEEKEKLKAIPYLTQAEVETLTDKKQKEWAKKEYEQLSLRKIQFLSKEDAAYPEKLKYIYDSPMGLYLKGTLPKEEKKTIAIIGARECSLYGKEIAQYFGRELGKMGFQVVSGLAKGIDGYAHIGALAGGGYTLGVLGSGIDVCYPKEHGRLYEEMAEKGGIISEYGPFVKPFPGNFPMRNRIISGVSEGILVIEAREKSGTHITIEYGLEQGKDIFVLPGRITDELSAGCNNLIKAGAIPVTTPFDLIQYYGLEQGENVNSFKKNNNVLENHEEMVYSKLCLELKHINDLLAESGLTLYTIMETLISLELKGYIKQPVKNYYIRAL